VWLGQNDIKSAVIKISPEELGPIEINVKVVKDNASVNIISHSAQVRDLVDQAIPRLRDMMAEQGLNLSDVQVNAEQRSNQFAQSGNSNNDQQHEATSSASDADDEIQLISSVKKGPKRLVDYFA
jgi:flagellar hook-length control protein FliK